VRRLRVVAVDRKVNRLTVTDAAGSRGMIRVQGPAAVRSLGRVRPGDVVSVTLTRPGTRTSTTTTVITEIQPLPSTTVLDQPVFVAPITGQLVRASGTDRTVTLLTSQGERVFTVSPAAASGLVTLTPGQSVTLDFGAATGASVFTPTGRVITGPIALGSATGTKVTASDVVVGDFPPVVAIQRAPAAPVASATAPVGPATGVVVATTTHPGVTVPGIVGPTSIYDSGVPSVPPAAPIVNAPLPPATARIPQSNDEVGTMREQALRDLDAAAFTLALKANELDAAWARFKNVCLTSALPPSTLGREWFLLLNGGVPAQTIDGCRTAHSDLTRMATHFNDQFAVAETAARQADVSPGTIREIWARHRLDH